MRQNLFQFYKTSFRNFFEAAVNLLIFLPYFFSVTTLSKTLFYPWKNLVAKKTTVGFSFSEWFNLLAFNLISRTIGFFMRFSILSFYFIIQILFFILIPIVTVLYFLIIPLLFIESFFLPQDEEKKKILKEKFISSHLLREENMIKVESWFSLYYQKQIYKTKWWKVSNLFSTPPLARDWTVGFTPVLDQYATDLTSSFYQKKMKNIVDREKEIGEIERELCKTEEANVIIVGEERVGKHTIVDALAKKIYEGKTNSSLIYKRILKLNMEKILSQYSDHTQRENFLEELFKEGLEAKNIIFLIDDFEKYIDFTVSIEKFAKTSDIQIIGITTPFFYQKTFFTNEKINRLFSKVDVCEISKTEAESILLDAALLFEQKHGVTIPYETVKNTIEKSDFYITYIPFPEKAIDLLDSACVFAKEVIKKNIVTPEIIDTILTEKTHTPTILTEDLKQKLLQLETLLTSEIVQQEEAVLKLSAALRQSFLLIGKRKKPLSTFLFLGPTGVGKTQTAKTIAEVFFANYLIRFDMSNYQSKQDIPTLIGSLESGNPGLLTAAVRQQPYGVLLLDEIEKADHDLINIFLTILDEGYFTDGVGKKVDCKSLVIIATSNAASTAVFSPEFLNRFDGIITYKPLTQQSIITIAKKMVDKIAKDIYQLHKVTLRVSEAYLTTLAQKGYHPKFGARDMERLIRQEIEDKAAKMILEGKVKEGDIISL